MAAHGVGGVQLRSMGHMGWGYGNVLREVRGVFSHTRLEVGDGLEIGFFNNMWCGDQPLKKPSQICIVLLALRMLL